MRTRKGRRKRLSWCWPLTVTRRLASWCSRGIEGIGSWCRSIRTHSQVPIWTQIIPWHRNLSWQWWWRKMELLSRPIFMGIESLLRATRTFKESIKRIRDIKWIRLGSISRNNNKLQGAKRTRSNRGIGSIIQCPLTLSTLSEIDANHWWSRSMKRMRIQMRSFLWIIKGQWTPIYQRLRTIAITKMVRFSYPSFQTFKKVSPTCPQVAKVELKAKQPEWTWLTAGKRNSPTQRILLKHETTHQLIIKQTSMRAFKSILVICNWIKRISSMTPWLRRWIRDKALTWTKERRTTRSTAKKSKLMRRLVQIANELMLKEKTFCQLMDIRLKTIPRLLILRQLCIRIQTTTVSIQKSIINLAAAPWPEVTKKMIHMAKRRSSKAISLQTSSRAARASRCNLKTHRFTILPTKEKSQEISTAQTWPRFKEEPTKQHIILSNNTYAIKKAAHTMWIQGQKNNIKEKTRNTKDTILIIIIILISTLNKSIISWSAMEEWVCISNLKTKSKKKDRKPMCRSVLERWTGSLGKVNTRRGRALTYRMSRRIKPRRHRVHRRECKCNITLCCCQSSLSIRIRLTLGARSSSFTWMRTSWRIDLRKIQLAEVIIIREKISRRRRWKRREWEKEIIITKTTLTNRMLRANRHPRDTPSARTLITISKTTDSWCSWKK